MKRGFSLIEIIMVLAIGGLILGTAFIGVPMLRRNQRDTIRKGAIENLAVGFKAYQSAHDGCLPSRTVVCPGTGAVAISPPSGELGGPIVTGGYVDLDDIGTDPTSNTAYQFVEATTVPASCTAATITYTRTNDKQFSLSVCLETNDVFTQDYGF